MTYSGFTEARKQANEKYRLTQDFYKVRLRPGFRDQLKSVADAEKKSLNEVINEAISQYLNGKSIE